MSLEHPALECGIPADESVMVAYLAPIESIMQEFHTADGVGYAQDGVLWDVIPAKLSSGMKWWRVKNFAREYRLNLPEPIWHGPAAEFVLSLLPDVLRPAGRKMYMRAYSRGPWIALEDQGSLDCLDADTEEQKDGTDGQQPGDDAGNGNVAA